MKRIGDLYQRICSMENLWMADEQARKGKTKQYGIIRHDMNREANLLQLRQMLLDKTYTTSRYTVFTIYEPKERLIYRLPYYPDRIVHHAVMNVLEPMFVAHFTADTYSCIKRKGIHAALRALKHALRDRANTVYCLKLDVRKFYPSIDPGTLKMLLRRKIKDIDLLQLLNGIIDSADGLPIGNYLSQYLANFYLSPFDHWIKEDKGVRYYFRYADDMVILSDDKDYLHALLRDIKTYLKNQLKIDVKANHQVFRVADRSIDFVGYRFYHTHILLRKSIKKSFARAVKRNAAPATIEAYKGWAKHANARHLTKKLLDENVQGLRDQDTGKKLLGRQDKRQQDTEPGDNGAGLQNSAQQDKHGAVPAPAPGAKQDQACAFRKLRGADAANRADTKGRFSVQDNDSRRG